MVRSTPLQPPVIPPHCASMVRVLDKDMSSCLVGFCLFGRTTSYPRCSLAHLMHLTRNCTLALTPPGLLLYSHRPRRRTSQQQRRQHPRPQPQLHGHPRQSSWWMLLPRAVKSKYGSGGLGAEGFALHNQCFEACPLHRRSLPRPLLCQAHLGSPAITALLL